MSEKKSKDYLKAVWGVDRFSGFGLGLSATFENVPVPHPYRRIELKQRSLILNLRFYHWDVWCMFYKPAKVALNRQERRANHLQ